MHADLLNPSRYLKAAEFLGADVTYTIGRVQHEEMERDDNTSENKGIIFFRDEKKGWVMNVVNAKSLAAMFGTETDNWVGKRVTLYPDPNVQAFGEKVTAIRVRGSPDLEQPVTFKFKSRKKKTRDIKLIPTGKPAQQRGQQPAANKPPSVLSRIQQVATDYEFPRGEKDADLLALIKKTCPERKSSAELTEDDFTKVEAAMVAAMQQPAAEGEPPITF